MTTVSPRGDLPDMPADRRAPTDGFVGSSVKLPLGVVQLRHAAIVCLLCVVALALRVHRLDAQSLWLDEGAAYHFASLSIPALIATTFSTEPNPPLYYLLLHFWIALAGSSEFSLRFLSTVVGVIAVAIVFRLGAAAISPGVGLGAALLTAVSPYLVWYAQEARMYALLATLSLGALLATWRAVRQPTWRAWLVAGVFLAATLYTHFYGLFVVGTAAMLIAAQPRVWRPGAITIGVATAGYLPWIVSVLAAGAARESWRAPVDGLTLARQMVGAFVHGGFVPDPAGRWVVLATVAIAVVGIVGIAVAGRGGALAAVLVAGTLVVPGAVVLVIASWLPIFAERYVIAHAPAFYLAIAAGLTLPFRRFAALSLPLYVPLIVVALVANDAAWHDRQFRKEDFRAAAAYLQEHATDQDAIVLLADYVEMPFAYYYTGSATVVPYWGSPERPEEVFDPIDESGRVIWLLLSHAEQVDPDNRVRQWLADRFPAVTAQFPQGVQLYGYRVAYRLDELPADAVPLDVQFGEGISLVGYHADDGVPPTDDRLHPPSNWVHVTLYWRADAAISEDYRSAVRLVDERGVWGEKLSRLDETLAVYPTSAWQMGEIVVEHVDVNLNPVTPPGAYRLEVGLVAPSGEAVPVTQGSAAIATVTIVAPIDLSSSLRPQTACRLVERVSPDLGERCDRLVGLLRPAESG